MGIYEELTNSLICIWFGVDLISNLDSLHKLEVFFFYVIILYQIFIIIISYGETINKKDDMQSKCREKRNKKIMKPKKKLNNKKLLKLEQSIPCVVCRRSTPT